MSIAKGGYYNLRSDPLKNTSPVRKPENDLRKLREVTPRDTLLVMVAAANFARDRTPQDALAHAETLIAAAEQRLGVDFAKG